MRKASKQLVLLILFCSLITGGISNVIAEDETDLQTAIEKKRQEAEALNKQINQTQSTITNLQGQGKTLNQAIGQIDTTIKQTDLNIRSSEVGIEKLGLEIESLSYEAREVGDKATSKQGIVGELLRSLQKNDKRTLLESLLTSGTLAEGVAEINALKALQDNLTSEVAKLVDLQGQLKSTIMVSGQKKSQLEVETINLENKKYILDDQKAQKRDLLVKTKNQEGEYQRLLTDLEQQQQTLLNEIDDIESRLSKGFDRSTVPSRQTGMLIWPVTSGGVPAGVLTQHYGETAYSSRYYRGRPHNGTDMGAPTGTEVRASANGTIAHVDYNGTYYQYGRYVLIDHGNGLTTLYAHLSRTIASPGARVAQGDIIGYVGSTGFSTGPHLHFGLYATPVGGWSRGGTREAGGLVSIPPANGLVPVGVTLNPEQYL
ncbi:peptidoglycan DD-metalloendopeptidase family protein [Patescibacteria group bacterium]|nr:peptidoglycan DD-metalloendopeptidase family protein [Patescibacteria group bacterium]